MLEINDASRKRKDESPTVESFYATGHVVVAGCLIIANLLLHNLLHSLLFLPTPEASLSNPQHYGRHLDPDLMICL